MFSIRCMFRRYFSFFTSPLLSWLSFFLHFSAAHTTNEFATLYLCAFWCSAISAQDWTRYTHTQIEREIEREPKLCQEKSNGSIQIIVAVQQEKLKTNKNLYIVILTTVRFDMCYYMLWNSLVNFDSSISLCRGDGALYSFVCAFVPSHLCALSVWHGPCQWPIGLMHIASITLWMSDWEPPFCAQPKALLICHTVCSC